MYSARSQCDRGSALRAGSALHLGTAKSLLMALLLFAMSIMGCGESSSGEPVGRVSGKVTFQGRPVTEGVVTFNDRSKGVYINAKLKSDGTYLVIMAQEDGLPVGTYQVAITPPPVDVPLGIAKAPPRPKKFPNIPQRYRTPASSGLKLTVKDGENSFDVDMKP